MSATDNPTTAHFFVQVQAEPQAMPRLLEVFALRSLMPERWRAERRGGELCVEIEIAGMAPAEAERLATRMRGMVLVQRVLTRNGPLARSA